MLLCSEEASFKYVWLGLGPAGKRDVALFLTVWVMLTEQCPLDSRRFPEYDQSIILKHGNKSLFQQKDIIIVIMCDYLCKPPPIFVNEQHSRLHSL